MDELCSEFEEKLTITPPTTVRIRIKGGKVVQDCDIYVGRSCTMGGWSRYEKVKKGNPTWLNPFKVSQKKYSGEKDKLAAVLKDYEEYIRDKMTPEMKEELRGFAGRSLGCFCTNMGSIDNPKCHAMILCRLFDELIKTGDIKR